MNQLTYLFNILQGVFLLNNINHSNKQTTPKKKGNTSLFNKWFCEEPWSNTFKTNWKSIEEKLKVHSL